MQVSSITKMAEEYVQVLIVHSLTLMVLFSCYCHVNATDSPPYAVVLSAPDLEIRLYRDSSWISATVTGGTSFDNSTHDGFHRLYQYIHGGNENNARFKITTPTVTTVVTAAASGGSSDYSVSMYMASISRPIPMPSPQLDLQISNWKSRCVAVRRFSGFAGDDNIYKERSLLSTSLAKTFIFNGKNVSISVDKSSYSVAQYNASSHLSGRVNEAWINVIPCPILH